MTGHWRPVTGEAALPRVEIVFRDPAMAEYRVAGVPAAARAAQIVARAFPYGGVDCTILTGHPWRPSAACREECARLAPILPIAHAEDAGPQTGPSSVLRLDGPTLVLAMATLPKESPSQDLLATAAIPPDPHAALRRASRAIVAATGKPGDGIVSRFVNRPISQRISAILLRIQGILPLHVTFGNAVLGLVMALCLLLGGRTGLLMGAVLFQAASILDGVDGEMARATDRTSDRGAMLDSLVDALTNLAFILGVTINLGISGDVSAALAGMAGLVMLASGLFLIGRRAKTSGQPVNFDVIKVHFRKRRSKVMQWLIWFTMRDFFAAAGALLILVGWTRGALFAFATVAAGWLTVTLTILLRTSQHRHRWTNGQDTRYAGREPL